jgi:hypothetical protein
MNLFFETVLQSVQIAMTPKTRAALEIYGTNKDFSRREFLDLYTKRTQLPVQIGDYMVYNQYNHDY